MGIGLVAIVRPGATPHGVAEKQRYRGGQSRFFGSQTKQGVERRRETERSGNEGTGGGRGKKKSERGEPDEMRKRGR